MQSSKSISLWAAVALIASIVLTRTQHFGSDVYLPDATLAALLLGGILVNARAWLALAILTAFAMDAYALGWKGVSDYCMSPGYWGLIPTYALVWGLGRSLKTRSAPVSTLTYALTAWLAFSLAFVVSNAFWYAFSDKVATLTPLQFSQAVSVYYLPYVGFALMYTAIGGALAKLFSSRLRLGVAGS